MHGPRVLFEGAGGENSSGALAAQRTGPAPGGRRSSQGTARGETKLTTRHTRRYKYTYAPCHTTGEIRGTNAKEGIKLSTRRDSVLYHHFHRTTLGVGCEHRPQAVVTSFFHEHAAPSQVSCRIHTLRRSSLHVSISKQAHHAVGFSLVLAPFLPSIPQLHHRC